MRFGGGLAQAAIAAVVDSPRIYPVVARKSASADTGVPQHVASSSSAASSTRLAPERIFFCHGFFTVIVAQSCEQAIPAVREHISALAGFMQGYGTTLRVYATLGSMRDNTKCQLCYPGVEILDFDPRTLLQKHGFDEQNIQATRDMSNQQQSDIYRLALAKETQSTYVDTDVLFLALSGETFLKEHIVASLWRENARALEVTNSAFCLPPRRLQRMLSNVKDSIRDSVTFNATLFSDMLFLRTFLNSEPVRVLSQNHPELERPSDIAVKVGEHNYPLLHLTPEIRKRAKADQDGRYLPYVKRVLNALNLTRHRPASPTRPDCR